MPVAYEEPTLKTSAAENEIERAFVFNLAIASPETAWCIERIVMAVAVAVGKTRDSS